MIQQKAIVQWNHPVSPDCFHLGLTTGQAFAKTVPGQFIMVQISHSGTPLLRRPFSVFGRWRDKETFKGIELLVKIVGEGTRMLSQVQTGDALDILGPLGHGFRLSAKDQRIYLAAGGIGVAPIRFLAAELVEQGVSPKNCRVFLGGRNKRDLLCRDDFKTLGIPLTITTDDGSDGDQCLITEPLELAIKDSTPDMVYACGPHAMLSCVAGIVERTLVPCQVSIETLMACGLGACLGCAVESEQDRDTYLHVCVNGPVFNVRQLRW
jgi:dihydroorotate dehydrogenase electron transfer subunit